MPGTLSSSDTIEQFKKAFRNLFRRRKATNAAAVVKPQAPARPARPRSASAVAAPEVLSSPEQPSWPIFGQLPPAGGFYCSPVELPGSLAPILQQRSKSDVGLTPPSDLFSELDATSLRRLSVIESESALENVPELDSPIPQLHLLSPQLPHQEFQTENEHIQLENETLPEEIEQLNQHAEEAFEDAEEHIQAGEQTEDLVQPADIPIPEGSDTDLEDSISNASEQELARNDSANGGKIFHDDSSSLYSTDESEFDVDSNTDYTATVSTPRTSSLARADTVDYFDEKIPVLSEPPQVAPVVLAPGMAATSGPLDDFPFH